MTGDNLYIHIESWPAFGFSATADNRPAMMYVLGPGNGHLNARLGAGSGDFAVYGGIVNLPSSDSPEYESRRMNLAHWVMGSGSKLTYSQAKAKFSGIAESDYRR